MSTLQVDRILANDGLETTEVEIPGTERRLAAAWVSFQAAPSTSIRSSFNVSSLVDLNVGDTQVNFATPFSTINYAFSATSTLPETQTINGTFDLASVRVLTGDSNGNRADAAFGSLIVFV